jgi:sugar phosphate isomerase/epimerase
MDADVFRRWSQSRSHRFSHRFSRRSFLSATTAALFTPALSACSRGPRFGVRSPFPDKDLRRRAELARRLGYDGIELGPEFLDGSADDIEAAMAGTGIAVSAIVGSLALLDPDPQARRRAVALDRRRIKLAQRLGAVGVIEVPVFGPCRFPELANTPGPHRKEDELLIEGLRALAPDLAGTGVQILIEPLTRKETHYMNLQQHGADVIEAASTSGMALLSDFYHMQLEESDIGQTLSKVGRHTAYVHLADGVQRTEPGSLPFDYRPGFRALKAHGFCGWLTMECNATDDPESSLRRALAYIKRQWADA